MIGSEVSLLFQVWFLQIFSIPITSYSSDVCVAEENVRFPVIKTWLWLRVGRQQLWHKLLCKDYAGGQCCSLLPSGSLSLQEPFSQHVATDNTWLLPADPLHSFGLPSWRKAKQNKDPSALQQSDRVRCHFLLRSSGSPSVWLCLHRALICCLLKFRQKDEPLVHCAVVIEGTEQFSYLSAWEAWAEVCPETSGCWDSLVMCVFSPESLTIYSSCELSALAS